MSSWQRWQCVGKYHHPSFYKNAKSEPGRDVWVPDVFHQCQEFPWVCLDSRETEKKRKTLGHQGPTQCALECYGARESEKKSGGRRRETRRVFLPWPCVAPLIPLRFSCCVDPRQLFVPRTPPPPVCSWDGFDCSQGQDGNISVKAYRFVEREREFEREKEHTERKDCPRLFLVWAASLQSTLFQAIQKWRSP